MFWGEGTICVCEKENEGACNNRASLYLDWGGRYTSPPVYWKRICVCVKNAAQQKTHTHIQHNYGGKIWMIDG